MADRTAALARTVHRIARPEPNTDLFAAFLRDRDPAAFEELVRRYGPLVRAACRAVLADPADADDAFQATFVALHKKAHTIRDGRTLGGWLFRVARRTALGVKAAGARRRDCETRAARREPVGGPDVSWREACAVLHEELDRLPPRYRLPLILCYLDGKTRDEAAAELGWTPDSVRGRLDRGRLRLRHRLEHRGITLSAFLLTAVAADAVPSDLIATTLTSAGTTGPGVSLAAGMHKAGLIAGLAAVAVVVGLAFQKDGAHGQPTREKPKPAAESAKKAEPDPTSTQTVSGIVVGPDGKGVGHAGVEIRSQDRATSEAITVTTDGDGRFKAVVPEIRNDRSMVAVAHADKLAAGWRTWTGPSPKEVRITLADDDVPVQGRIIDLEGKPLAGITVRVQAAQILPNGGAQAFVNWWGRPMQMVLQGAPPGATDKAVTGADGKFRLTGLGCDRVVELHVSGPGIAYEHIYVGTVPKLKDPGGPRADKTYPATFDHPATPARLIRGTARDLDTGKPVPGLLVNGYGGDATTTTDAQGRYELPGIKKGPRYTVFARPADGSVYFPTMAKAADTAGLDPLTIDLKVKAGIPVRGRLKDAATGKPVVGTVHYWALAGNPHVDDIPVVDPAGMVYTLDVRTKPDGTFTIATLPGKGFLSVTADGWYPAARVDPAGFAENVGIASTPDKLAIAIGGMAITSVEQESYQAIRFVTIDATKPPDEQVIELTPAEPVRGRVVDPAGKPLDDVRLRGLVGSHESWSSPRPGEFLARPPHPDRPRRLMFRHDGRKLIGTAVVTAGSARPVEFKLQPWATLTGRLVDGDGRPIPHANIRPFGRDRDGKVIAWTDDARGTLTDAEGRFTADCLLPDFKYSINFGEPKPGGRRGVVAKDLSVKPGEKRDLGDLKVPPPGR